LVTFSVTPIFVIDSDIMEKKWDTTTLSVHRCRFVDYAPSAITALAFPPLPLPSVRGIKKKTTAGKQSFKFGLLAIGHANGNIDLCEWMGAESQTQCSQAWVVRKVCAFFLTPCLNN
jgi:U3 small nucleolar RNA-associated protein 4